MSKHNPRGHIGKVEVKLLIFLIWHYTWSASRYNRFTPEERAPGTDWTGGWMS